MTIPPPLTAKLHHISLGTPDPGALAAWHAKVIGLTLMPLGEDILGISAHRRIIFSRGDRGSLAKAGFAVPDQPMLDGLVARLDAYGWPYARIGQRSLFEPGAIELADPDGNHLAFGLTAANQAECVAAGLPARLQHVVVASRNARNISDFYQQALGFLLSDNVVDETGDVKTSFLRCSEEHHSFAVFQASTDRLDHHCYEAGDWGLIRDWGDWFASHDVKVEWGPGRHGPGNNLFLFVHDPDGNWLEISAELEIVAPDRPAGEWPHTQKTLNSWGTAPLRT